MELFFNFAWAFVALASVFLWTKQGRRTLRCGHSPLIGLAMLVVLLFPVISVSDDLWSLRHPAETDVCQRRDHRDGSSYNQFQIPAALPEPIGTKPDFQSGRLGEPRRMESVAIAAPPLGPLANRPPPAF